MCLSGLQWGTRGLRDDAEWGLETWVVVSDASYILKIAEEMGKR